RPSRSSACWRTSAPRRRPPASARVASSAATRLRSTTTAGRTRRMFIIGTRLWPPARSLASSPCRARRSSASSMLRGAKYSKGAGRTRAGLHLPELRVVEHRQLHAPRCHAGADLLDELGDDAHLVLGGGAAEPGLAGHAVGVDLERGGGAALDGEPEV